MRLADPALSTFDVLLLRLDLALTLLLAHASLQQRLRPARESGADRGGETSGRGVRSVRLKSMDDLASFLGRNA